MMSPFLKSIIYISLPQHAAISPALPWLGKIECSGCGPVSLPWSASISPAPPWLAKIEWSCRGPVSLPRQAAISTALPWCCKIEWSCRGPVSLPWHVATSTALFLSKQYLIGCPPHLINIKVAWTNSAVHTVWILSWIWTIQQYI